MGHTMREPGKGAPEVCLNLWYVIDGRSQLVHVLYARAYVLAGSDEEKMETLQRLARYDFTEAKSYRPNSGVDASGDGVACQTVTPYAVMLEPLRVFAEFLDELEENPPRFTVSPGTEADFWQFGVAEEPMWLLTMLYDDAHGNLWT